MLTAAVNSRIFCAMKTDLLTQVGYKIVQDEEQFCFGIDAVLLADFASKKIRHNSNVIDLCSGNGIIALLVCGATKAQTVTALEIQKESCALAEESVRLNGLQERLHIVNGDLKNAASLFEKYSFDAVVCNPPYMKASHGRESAVNAKAIARHEILCTLEDVIKAADYLLKPNGSFFMIHRPERLGEIFVELNRHKLEASELRMVQPDAESAPTMVLIQAKKNIKPNLKVDVPLVVYKAKGVYTDEVKSIYSAEKQETL